MNQKLDFPDKTLRGKASTELNILLFFVDRFALCEKMETAGVCCGGGSPPQCSFGLFKRQQLSTGRYHCLLWIVLLLASEFVNGDTRGSLLLCPYPTL